MHNDVLARNLVVEWYARSFFCLVWLWSYPVIYLTFLRTITGIFFIHLTKLKIRHCVHVHNINFNFIILFFTINTILVHYFFLSPDGDIEFHCLSGPIDDNCLACSYYFITSYHVVVI